MGTSISLQYQDSLIKDLEEVSEMMAATADQYLAAAEDLRRKKLALDRAVDYAYRDGVVEGRNEREREAFLRTHIPGHYEEVEAAIQILSTCERAYRKADIQLRRVEGTIKLVCLETHMDWGSPESTPQTP